MNPRIDAPLSHPAQPPAPAPQPAAQAAPPRGLRCYFCRRAFPEATPADACECGGCGASAGLSRDKHLQEANAEGPLERGHGRMTVG